jgi:LytS/YehU family sensor histidine kinase
LQGALQPHFLFNALNTIASRVYDDPEQADRMITQLSELLRASVKERNVERVPLRRELELLDHYAALIQARFGARFVLERNIDERAMAAKVPALLLQPLVENAVRHGNLSRTGSATVRVSVARVNDSLEVTVIDDGPGASGDPWSTDGIGLRATAERLSLLYGDRQSMVAANENGGFAVRIRMPHERADGG